MDAVTTPHADQVPLDEVLAAAVDLARAAAVQVGGDTVGAHLVAYPEDEHVVSHAFASTLPGYAGWMWVATLARTDASDHVTVDEVVLLPGEGALLAPAWVPWQRRVRPGDLAPGDLLPREPGDPRLVPGYVESDDPAVADIAWELGLGREWVMSREGRLDAAERWFGDHGPRSSMARHAPARCGTCGFLLPLAGSLRAGFGVCGNEYTEADGRVVSVEYGCGAHSDVLAAGASVAERAELVYDDGDAPL
jgi:hypothetical protein